MYLDNPPGQWFGNGFEEFRVFHIWGSADVLDHQTGQMVQVAASDLYRQKKDHGHPVEHVMKSSTSKRSSETGFVSDLPQRDEDVGDGCADIGAHDDWDGETDRQHWNHTKNS